MTRILLLVELKGLDFQITNADKHTARLPNA